jgi:uncharacterized membrane protein
MSDFSTREPLIIRGAVVAAVTAVVHLLVILGVLPIDAEAEQATALVVDLVGTAVLVVWTRGKVSPVDSGGDHVARPEDDGLGQ